MDSRVCAGGFARRSVYCAVFADLIGGADVVVERVGDSHWDQLGRNSVLHLAFTLVWTTVLPLSRTKHEQTPSYFSEHDICSALRTSRMKKEKKQERRRIEFRFAALARCPHRGLLVVLPYCSF